MSETDNTDDLLVASPQLLDNITHDSFAPYYHIVDNLISQVYKLKNRITHIENKSQLSTENLNNPLASRQVPSSNSSLRKSNSCDSIPRFVPQPRRSKNPQMPPGSTQSTPQKPRSKLILNSIPNTPTRPHKSKSSMFKRSDTKKPDEDSVVQEIDRLLTNAKFDKESDIELNYEESKSKVHENKVIDDIEQIFKEMDEQQAKINNMSKDAISKNLEIENVSNKEPNKSKSNSDIEFSSNPELNRRSSIKRNLFKDTSREFKLSLDGESSNSNSEGTIKSDDFFWRASLHGGKEDKDEENRDVNYELHMCAQDALSMHKKLLKESYVPLESKKHKKPSNALSLVDLWSANSLRALKDAENNNDQLLEERRKRMHCEEIITQLQNRIMEQQQKLAVAIQVDEKKDDAIIRFHDAWEKVSLKFKLVYKEKEELQNQLQKVILQNQQLVSENAEKLAIQEKEASKASTSVEKSQEMIYGLESKCQSLTSEVEAANNKYEQIRTQLSNEIEKNKQLSALVGNKELELNEIQSLLNQARNEVTQSKGAVEMCQKDFTTIKCEYGLVQDELANQKSIVEQLHSQNKRLFEDLDTQKNTEKNLKKEIKELQEKMDTNKAELRNFYQGQVELVVQTKLKEFQAQLDDAEKALKEQLHKKEMEVAKAAAAHIQQVTEKYTLEINLLEQKQKEEIHLRDLKVAQLQQKIGELQSKFERQQEKRSHIAKQLQRVMEAQWVEALRIINSNKSPVNVQESSSSTIEHLTTLQSKSYQNIEDILSIDNADPDNYKETNEVPSSDVPSTFSNKDYCNSAFKTPVSTRSDTKKKLSDNNLQKYIHMLLTKETENPYGLTHDIPKANELPTMDS